MVIVLANWFDPRLISLFGLITDAGTLIFPLTFLLADLITEVYGYKQARRAIWTGFLFNAVFILYGQLIIHLPGPQQAPYNAMFDQLLTMNSRIIFASAMSYLVAEGLNSILMAKLKIKLAGGYMGLRFISSTFVAAGVDSLVFTSLAFYAVLPDSQLINLMLTMWLIKVTVELVGLPFSVKLANRLKKTEQMDIYDQHTKFNLFSLEADYQARDNHLWNNKP
jgi:uncharacterized integral membrane protein (TIGR00697 family)